MQVRTLKSLGEAAIADRTFSAAEPFLARDALFGLTLAPPLVMLLTVQMGVQMPTMSRFAGSLLANWIATVVVGCVVHLVVNFSAPRLLATIAPRWFAYVTISMIAAVSVIGTLLAILPPLGVLCSSIQEGSTPLLMRGIGIAAAYLITARTVAVLGGRAKREGELARTSEAVALRARIAALQAQMNPHFLFNTLNAVAGLIHEDPALAEATVERLAGVLQYAIVSGKRGSVPLRDELSAVRDYLEIEEARFGDRLRFHIDVSPELGDHAIVPMLLQPLVENAVLHGLASREQGGEIWITGRNDHGVMVLTVSDDGVGPGRSTRRGTRIGISSVRERLELTYGSASAFAVRERVGGGFECELRIPSA